MSKFLLDTHVWLWLVMGNARLTQTTVLAIEGALNEGDVHLSQISLWEVAHKASVGKIQLNRPLGVWLQENAEGINLIDLPLDVIVESTQLPGTFHKDPADRFIVATARARGLTLVTGDDLILAYAKAGHVDVLAI